MLRSGLWLGFYNTWCERIYTNNVYIFDISFEEYFECIYSSDSVKYIFCSNKIRRIIEVSVSVIGS